MIRRVSVLCATACALGACAPSAPSFELGGAIVRVESREIAVERDYRWPITVTGDSATAYLVAYEVHARGTGVDTTMRTDRLAAVILGRGDSLAWHSYQSTCSGYSPLDGCVARAGDPRPVVKVLGIVRTLK